jgi:iron complex transport system substrate-binding protein
MRHVRLLITLLLTAALAACGTESPPNGGAAGNAPETAGYEPVTVESCGEKTTYTEPPERAVANDINMTEIMLALGLKDRMAGIAGVKDKGEILPEYREAFDKVPKISDENLPSREALLGVEADFVFAGWNYGFSEESGITPESLKELGINSYAIRESCIRQGSRPPISIRDTYEDILNIGRIFGVEDRARELVEGYEEQVAQVDSRLSSDPEPLRVFVYDSGEEAPFTAGGEAIPNELIRLAGGENIFEDVNDSWTTVNWEEVVERDPEFIVIVDYGTPSAEGKIDYLANNPALAELDAVRERRFVVLPYAAATPGVRNADAVETLAEAFHPEAS